MLFEVRPLDADGGLRGPQLLGRPGQAAQPAREAVPRPVAAMETLTKHFESRVDGFLERTGLKPSMFGLRATGDPNLMRQLRRGRSPTLALADRVLAFMDDYDRADRDRVSARSRPLGEASRRDNSDRAVTRGVQARTGLSPSTIYLQVTEGSFHMPVCAVGSRRRWTRGSSSRPRQAVAKLSDRCTFKRRQGEDDPTFVENWTSVGVGHACALVAFPGPDVGGEDEFPDGCGQASCSRSSRARQLTSGIPEWKVCLGALL